MKKGLLLLSIVVLCLGVGFTGCAKKDLKHGGEVDHGDGHVMAPRGDYPPVGPAVEIDAGLGDDYPVVTAQVVTPPSRDEHAAGAEAVVLSDVFFDFDRHFVRDDARGPLNDNAKALKKNPGTRVTIEGHCDERGTIEYNVALGERRARAVKDFLVDLGVDSHRLSIISYGKEKPFCTASNEECWQSNRRGHLVAK